MQHYRQLTVWKAAHELVLGIYEATERFSPRETYGLVSQMRRAAVSVPANVAEGCARGSDRDFARFSRIAFGSANELDYLLLLAADLEMLERSRSQRLRAQATDVKRMLAALIKRLTKT